MIQKFFKISEKLYIGDVRMNSVALFVMLKPIGWGGGQAEFLLVRAREIASNVYFSHSKVSGVIFRNSWHCLLA